MRIGYQGEPGSYSHRATAELFPDDRGVGFEAFVAAFDALAAEEVDRLVLPIENSTTGSVLPVLDRLVPGGVTIIGEHMIEVQHSILGVPGSTLDGVRKVRSHPEALAQTEGYLTRHGWERVVAHDTAGAVRQVAANADPEEVALAPPWSAGDHGLEVLASNVVDREHNTTRFVVIAAGDQPVAENAGKTTVAFTTSHTPGALALALTELGLRGANLTRIESRPTEQAWRYRFFADITHNPGLRGRALIFDPPAATIRDLTILGTYPAHSGLLFQERSFERVREKEGDEEIHDVGDGVGDDR